MPYEITAWKSPDCSLTLKISQFSDRETFSREINERLGEGGALNADYRTAEALAKVANLLGMAGFVYGEDFVFKTSCSPLDELALDFSIQSTKERVKEILMN
ncbi:MAG: hypothetical protein ABIF84_02170 [Patescibacteria group bacterium]